MKRPCPTDARIDGRIAVIELRSLLVADACIDLGRKAHLIRRASLLVRSPREREAIAERLRELIEKRFGRNPETLLLSPATEQALKLLSELQNGTV